MFLDVTIPFRVGAWLRYHVLRSLRLRRAQSWVFTEATIKSHRLETGGREFSYVVFTYVYVVDGAYYSGEFRQYLPLLRNHKLAAEEYFARFPDGMNISIKFDPQHPGQSVKEA